MDKQYTIKILSEGNTQWKPDINLENFSNDFFNRRGLMIRDEEEYWVIERKTLLSNGRCTYYFYKTDKDNNCVVSYDLSKLIDYKLTKTVE